VRGLTTAASIWIAVAIGAAAGAGLPWLAVATTVAYLIVTLAYGRGILRQVLKVVTERGFAIDELATQGVGGSGGSGGSGGVRVAVLGVARVRVEVGETGSEDRRVARGHLCIVAIGPGDSAEATQWLPRSPGQAVCCLAQLFFVLSGLGGVAAAGGRGPAHDAGLGLLEFPAGCVLGVMMSLARWAEVVLTGCADGVRDRVVDLGCDGLGTAAGRGAADRAGADEVL
jgi:hypothetical protein